MADQVEFKISESLIRPILEAKINTAVIEAMGGHEKIITDMLETYMKQKVDSEGKVSGYSNNIPRLDWLMNKMISDALKVALTSYLEGKKEFMQAEFQRFFNSKKGSSKLIEAMQTGFVDSLTKNWMTTITFKLHD
jgi:hypothetical protein